MGEVWKARDGRLGRIVAIKISGERFTDRFEREARAVAALNHPNICTLYDVGPDYLVMEFVDGTPIAPIEGVRKLLDVATQIADGLSAAHAADILHRDLKPGNILITREGRVKILDFGLAKSMAPAQDDATAVMTVTQPGTVLGTIAYMSPEQARNAPLDARSDQFCFGLVLYELASGKRAFDRPTIAETLTAIIREEYEPMPPAIPAPLRWIIERLLAKDPEERYASTKDLYHDLRGLRERLSEASAEVTGPTAEPPPKRILLKLLLLTGLLTGILIALMLPRLQPDFSAYRITPVSRDEATEQSPVWSPDGKSVAYEMTIHGLRQVFTWTLGSSNAAQLTHSKGNCYWPFWSPDGSTIYFTSGNDTWSVPVSGGAPQLVVKNGRAGTISPDGKTFAFVRNNRLWIGPPGEGQAREYANPSFPSTQLNVFNAHFSPDGSKLAVAAASPSGGFPTWIIPYPTGTPRKLHDEQLLNVHINWFPDNRRLIMAQPDGGGSSLVIVDTETGGSRAIYKSPDALLSPAVSPDGKRIVYAAGPEESDLIEIGVPDGAVTVMLARGGRSETPDWAPSGTHYLFATDVNGIHAIDDRTPKEDFTRRLISASSQYWPAVPEVLHSPRWAPEGERFTFVAGAGLSRKTWVAHTSGGRPVNIDPSAESFGASWSPDGLWIAYYRRTEGIVGKAQIAKIGTSAGAAPAVLKEVPRVFDTTQWAPSGDWILYRGSDGLALVSADGKQDRTLTGRTVLAYGFSKNGDQVYGVFLNRDQDSALWQLLSVDVKTGSEKFLAPLNLPPATHTLDSFSLHPDGKRFATSIEKWSYDLWMLEGFEQEKSWLDRLLRR